MWRDSESEQDFLNFTEVADQVVTLVTNAALLPISVGVFGGWGTGKSTVLRLVESRLPGQGNGGPLVVKFDAWLYQGFDDARAALMETVSVAVEGLATEKKTLVEKARDFAGRVNYFRALGTIADFGVGVAFGIPPGLLTRAGGAVASLIAGDGSEEDLTQVKEGGKAAVKEMAGWIKPQEKRTPPAQINAFRKQFGELLEGLDTTLVLFIDNLDRCLPDVAIATLEAVRLFLFMPRTAFVIAADEGMIRHSVAKHFRDPQASHVRDYLDKVIQVPLHVPQVGVEDLRAYMYSLFVGLAAPVGLEAVQQHLLAALQSGWKGTSFAKEKIDELAGTPSGLLDRLAIADRLAPILASAPNVQGNPRIVKRLLNAVLLRESLAKGRAMNVDLATLTKLAVFERCTDEPATLVLYRLIVDGKEADQQMLPPDRVKGKAPDLPVEWKPHEGFVTQWREMDPIFEGVDLRPAVFLSRDVMAPAHSRTGLSTAAQQALEALMKVTSVTSTVGKAIVEKLTPADRGTVMASLIESMRQADWATTVPGLHGGIVLAKSSPEAAAALKSFAGSLQTDSMEKGMRYVLKQAGFIT